MAKRTELLYWDAVQTIWVNARYRWWKVALTPDDWESAFSYQTTDISPITALHISDAVGGSRRAQVTLVNRPRRIGSTTANESKGRFTGVFTDFQNVRLLDGENGSVLFAGKIYHIEDKFDFQYGTSIILDMRDSIEELKDSRTGGWPDLALTGGSSTRSASITTVIDDADYVDSDLIAIAGENKVTTSLRKAESSGKLEFKGNKPGLAEIAQLASEEPHSAETREGVQIALVNEASDVNATATVIDVDGLLLGYANAAAALAANDYIQIDTEIMKVSSISTNAITVIRGVRGTTAATHADDAKVYRNPGASKYGWTITLIQQ